MYICVCERICVLFCFLQSLFMLSSCQRRWHSTACTSTLSTLSLLNSTDFFWLATYLHMCMYAVKVYMYICWLLYPPTSSPPSSVVVSLNAFVSRLAVVRFLFFFVTFNAIAFHCLFNEYYIKPLKWKVHALHMLEKQALRTMKINKPKDVRYIYLHFLLGSKANVYLQPDMRSLNERVFTCSVLIHT